MKTIDKDTTEVARVVALGWGVSKDKGTPYLALTMRVADGDYMGALVSAELYFTDNEKNAEVNERQLEALGWDGVKLFSALTREDLGKAVLVDIEIERFDSKPDKQGEIHERQKAAVKFIRPMVRVPQALAASVVAKVYRRFQAMRGEPEASGREPGQEG